MARALEILDRLLRWTCIALMGLMSVFVIASVILRYSFNLTYTWAEEAITMLFVAITYFGSALATHRGEHITMNWFDNLGGASFFRLRSGAASCVVIAVSLICAWNSLEWIATVGDVLSPGLLWPMKVFYSMLPVSFGLIAFFEMVRLAGAVSGRNPEREGAPRT